MYVLFWNNLNKAAAGIYAHLTAVLPTSLEPSLITSSLQTNMFLCSKMFQGVFWATIFDWNWANAHQFIASWDNTIYPMPNYARYLGGQIRWIPDMDPDIVPCSDSHRKMWQILLASTVLKCYWSLSVKACHPLINEGHNKHWYMFLWAHNTWKWWLPRVVYWKICNCAMCFWEFTCMY